MSEQKNPIKTADKAIKAAMKSKESGGSSYDQMKAIEKTMVDAGNTDQAGFADAISGMGKPGGMSYSEMRMKYG